MSKQDILRPTAADRKRTSVIKTYAVVWGKSKLKRLLLPANKPCHDLRRVCSPLLPSICRFIVNIIMNWSNLTWPSADLHYHKRPVEDAPSVCRSCGARKHHGFSLMLRSRHVHHLFPGIHVSKPAGTKHADHQPLQSQDQV